MRRLFPGLLAGAAAIAACSALAQQDAPPQPAPPPSVQQPPLSQPPRPTTEEGFFRPETPPVLTAFPEVPEPAATSPAPQPEAVAPFVEALVAQSRAREGLERELDRAERENRAHAEAVRKPPPLIASPLDGTAPIVSPLDR